MVFSTTPILFPYGQTPDDTMMRTEPRFDPKRKRVDSKKTQFAPATYKEQEYPYRLSFYNTPPTQEISLEEFETWAIDRLRSTTLKCFCDLLLTLFQSSPNSRLVPSETNLPKRPQPISNHCSRNTFPSPPTRPQPVVWLINA